MFYAGQRIFVGYTPDCRVAADARGYRCRRGTIDAGPFPPVLKSPQTRLRLCGAWYRVAVNGELLDVAAHMLFPFEDAETEVTEDKAVETT